MNRKRRYTDEQLIAAVEQADAIVHVLRTLGLREAGGNYLTIRQRIKALGLETSHWRGQAWLRGKKNPHAWKRKLPMETILVKDSTYVQSNDLKKRLIAEGYFVYRCMSCQLDAWLSEPIPLELHHVNGDRMDHRLENLQLLCPNCHALTPTYRARNKGKIAVG
jgi:5-methylcytosine-specific restriction endonuclease McrA